MELIINTIILILLLNRSYSIYCSGSTQSGKVRRLFSHIFPVHLTNNAGSVLGKKQCSDCLLLFLRPIETATSATKTTTTTQTSATSATTATAVAAAQVRGCKWSQVTGLCSHFALLLNKLETQKKFEAKNGRINDSLRIIKRNISFRRWDKRKLILSWVKKRSESGHLKFITAMYSKLCLTYHVKTVLNYLNVLRLRLLLFINSSFAPCCAH